MTILSHSPVSDLRHQSPTCPVLPTVPLARLCSLSRQPLRLLPYIAIRFYIRLPIPSHATLSCTTVLVVPSRRCSRPWQRQRARNLRLRVISALAPARICSQQHAPEPYTPLPEKHAVTRTHWSLCLAALSADTVVSDGTDQRGARHPACLSLHARRSKPQQSTTRIVRRH